jgi:lysophospholipase L1-like esterase
MRFAVILLLLAGTLPAQDPTAGAPREQLERELEAYRMVLMDYGGLTYYGSDNTELRRSPDVVFLGDEITENWGKGEAKFFPGRNYLNRGITRQTSAQMLVRFRQDVIDLKPKVVVIEAGSNDLARVLGPASEGTVAEHFMSMVDLAKVHGIRVVLCSVTPVCDCAGKKMTAIRSPGRIIAFNGWLKRFAAENGAVYLDYYGALVRGRAMNKDLTVDGFLPNDAGYEAMAPLAEKAIAGAMAEGAR